MSASFVVGGQCNDSQQEESTNMTTWMEISNILPKPPLIVINGTNMAYTKTVGLRDANSLLWGIVEPDVQGIYICDSYVENAGCRVQVVLPIYWMRNKSQGYNYYRNSEYFYCQLTNDIQMEYISLS